MSVKIAACLDIARSSERDQVRAARKRRRDEIMRFPFSHELALAPNGPAGNHILNPDDSGLLAPTATLWQIHNNRRLLICRKDLEPWRIALTHVGGPGFIKLKGRLTRGHQQQRQRQQYCSRPGPTAGRASHKRSLLGYGCHFQGSP